MKWFLGADLNKYFGTEIGNLAIEGQFEESQTHHIAKAEGIYGIFKGKTTFNSNFKFVPFTGMWSWEECLKQPDNECFDEGNDLIYGIRANYSFTNDFFASLDYTRYTIGKDSIEDTKPYVLGLNIGYKLF